MFIYIKLGSITNAQRANSILKRYGIKSSVIRSNNVKSGDGCGYMLKVRAENKNAVHILRENGIKILGVIDE